MFIFKGLCVGQLVRLEYILSLNFSEGVLLSGDDVCCYFSRKLIDSVFTILLIFILWCEIQMHWFHT